ncbi:MAG: BppU family phage baseplate upper protein [Enterococcus sp.]
MFKIKEEVIVIQVEAIDPIDTGVVFWSHDKGTAKLIFELHKDHVNQSLTEGTIVPILLEFNSATAENGRGKHIYHAVIEDAVNGIVSIVLEDNILGYIGRVDGSIYIELPDSRSLDTAGRFTFDIKRSPIDENVPELEDYYWQGFSEIMEQYHESIAEIKSEAKALLDNLTADVTKVKNDIATANVKIAEIRQKLDDNDVFTKAESSANVIDNIASSEIATLKKVFLIDGLGGKAYRESDSGLVDCSANDYTALISDASYIRTEFATAGEVAGFEFYFNVLDVLEKKYTFFKHLNTTAEKVALLKTYVKKHNCTSVLRGGNGSNNGARLALGLNGTANWAGASGWVTSTDFKSNTQNASTTSLLSATGVARFRAYSHTYASDGLTPAWVEVKDISLTVELEVNGRTIIESMIAQNHVENLATTEEAKAGTNTTKTMTPATTAQSIDNRAVTLASNQTIGGIKNFQDGLMVGGDLAVSKNDHSVFILDASNCDKIIDGAATFIKHGALVIALGAFKFKTAVAFGTVISSALPAELSATIVNGIVNGNGSNDTAKAMYSEKGTTNLRANSNFVINEWFTFGGVYWTGKDK